MNRLGLVVLWYFLAYALVFAPVYGQTTFGTITGTVTDSSGAVIPQVTVQVINIETGLQREVTTASTGVFTVPNLIRGVYRVRIEDPRFTRYERTDLRLRSNEVINVDAELKLSEITQSVDVVALPTPINTQTGSLSSLVTSEQIAELPLDTRQFGDDRALGFVILHPGVSSDRFFGWYIANGNRTLDVMNGVDGIVSMAHVDGVGGSVTQSGTEATQEITLELANTSAEFARPEQYSTITKNGTNDFHGTVFYGYNGNSLNTRNFFSNVVPFRVYNGFGGSLGGPIKRNKTFFFGDYEGSRESTQTVVADNVPLPSWRSGDFSGVSRTIVDPLTGQPFPGNIIPPTRISQVSQKLQDLYYPLPNFGSPGLLSGNWRGLLKPALSGTTHYNSFDVRIDHVVNDRNLVFASFNYIDIPRTSWQGGSLPPFGLRKQLRQARSGVISWNHMFSPKLLNEFRVGFAREKNDIRAAFIGSDILKQVGIQGISVTGIPVVPVLSITGITTASQVPRAVVVDTTFQWTNNLSWTRGSHSAKFGFSAIRDRVGGRTFRGEVYGTYSFTGAVAGFPYADFLLGLPQATSRVIPTPVRHAFGTWWGAYAQDQWKVRRDLTLTYGLRWEGQGPYYDEQGLLSSFNPKTGALVIPDDGLPFLNPLFPKNIPIETASQANYPRASLLVFRRAYFYPRFGFAYRPFSDDKTVIRGAYGIFGNNIYGGANLSGGPFSGSESFTNRIVNSVPLFSFPEPFLPVGRLPAQNANGVDPQLRVPYLQQWNFTIERRLGSIGLSIAYVGAKATNLVYTRNLNQLPPSTTPFDFSRLPYPLYNAVIWRENGGNESYNALQISATKNYGNNLTFKTGWTWAKDLTDTQDQRSFAGVRIQNAFDRRADRGNSGFVNPHKLVSTLTFRLPVGRGQPYLSKIRPLVDSVIGGWKVASILIAQTGPYFTPTFSGFDPSNTNNFGGRPDRVSGISTIPPSGRTIQGWFNGQAFKIPGCPDTEPLCSSPGNVGRFGDVGLNTLQGPGMTNLGLALMKEFNLTERFRLQFRAEAVNALNHPNFDFPATDIVSPGTVGQITSPYSEFSGALSRQITFNLRLIF